MAIPANDVAQILVFAYLPLAAVAAWGLPDAFKAFYVAHPAFSMVGSFLLPIVLLGYTHPYSPLRLALFPLITIASASYHTFSPFVFATPTEAGSYDGPFMLLWLCSVDALLLQRLYLDAQGNERSGRKIGFLNDKKHDDAPQTPGLGVALSNPWTIVQWIAQVVFNYRGIDTAPGDFKVQPSLSQFPVPGGQTKNPWKILQWGAHILLSYRAINSPREVKNVPQFPGNVVPSRLSFLSKQILACIGAYFALDVLGSLQRSPAPEDFSLEKASLLLPAHLWTSSLLTTRIVTTLFFWLGLRLTIGFVYNFASVVGVATFLTKPADWPPYFRGPQEAWTLRRFWAVFWHSGLRNPCVTTANFLTYDALRLGKGTLPARYLSIFLTFGISGVFHWLTDVCRGIPDVDNTAYVLFVMQAVGITIEDFAQWVYKSATGSTKKSATWHKLLGYAWVVVWLVWTTPSWSYSNVRHPGDPLFPYSVVESDIKPALGLA